MLTFFFFSGHQLFKLLDFHVVIVSHLLNYKQSVLSIVTKWGAQAGVPTINTSDAFTAILMRFLFLWKSCGCFWGQQVELGVSLTISVSAGM